MVRNGQWGETDHPLFLEKLWMKCVGDTTCTDTVLPVVACHTSSLPVQVILLSARRSESCVHGQTQSFVTSGSSFLTILHFAHCKR